MKSHDIQDAAEGNQEMILKLQWSRLPSYHLLEGIQATERRRVIVLFVDVTLHYYPGGVCYAQVLTRSRSRQKIVHAST